MLKKNQLVFLKELFVNYMVPHFHNFILILFFSIFLVIPYLVVSGVSLKMPSFKCVTTIMRNIAVRYIFYMVSKECPAQWLMTIGSFLPQPTHFPPSLVVNSSPRLGHNPMCIQEYMSLSFLMTLVNGHPELDLICLAKMKCNNSSTSSVPEQFMPIANALQIGFAFSIIYCYLILILKFTISSRE